MGLFMQLNNNFRDNTQHYNFTISLVELFLVGFQVLIGFTSGVYSGFSMVILAYRRIAALSRREYIFHRKEQ